MSSVTESIMKLTLLQSSAETPEVGGTSFGILVNPIWTKGACYAHHIITGPPIFFDDVASLW